MTICQLLPTAGLTLAAVAGSIAFAAQSQDTAKPAQQPPAMQLPPGWTQADVEACMLAGTPGEMHQALARDAGTWHGKNTMWMAPGAEPMTCESTTTITPIMDGRYVRAEMKGEMPGMGMYEGFGLYGYDNVSGRFVATMIDNMSTGLATGTGERSADGKTMTWTYTYNCPITKKPTTLREVQTTTGPNAKRLEMWGTDPRSGKEYKMMVIELTR